MSLIIHAPDFVPRMSTKCFMKLRPINYNLNFTNCVHCQTCDIKCPKRQYYLDPTRSGWWPELQDFIARCIKTSDLILRVREIPICTVDDHKRRVSFPTRSNATATPDPLFKEIQRTVQTLSCPADEIDRAPYALNCTDYNDCRRSLTFIHHLYHRIITIC